MNPVLQLSSQDWLSLFNHFASLSLLAVGGAITTAPDMHRFLVDETRWLSEAQFTSSIALAQAAPGPNILFVALMGFNVGLNAGAGLGGGWVSVGLASLGVVVTMVGIMLPSSVLTYTATRWAHQHREKLGIRAFKSGMARIVIALLLATAWLLTMNHTQPARDWPVYGLTALTTVVVWRTKVHMLWLIGFGALLGVLGWV
ncbi:chromate transporter [Limnohabitans sp. 2KL-17]|uniref:chromate transporter n=1 Tax=Limnohabitans sp. 2KL-17 TaxID=1100704 RepID=UPI000D393C80|nr:chromate transporter [Limnohabitans sp. 2KL-17]PUE63222.1 chromate transporter [Limnohabitans sp. 2KL-17]